MSTSRPPGPASTPAVASIPSSSGPSTKPAAVWAAVSPVSDRCVYGGVVEHSVYVDPLTPAEESGQSR